MFTLFWSCKYYWELNHVLHGNYFSFSAPISYLPWSWKVVFLICFRFFVLIMSSIPSPIRSLNCLSLCPVLHFWTMLSCHPLPALARPSWKSPHYHPRISLPLCLGLGPISCILWLLLLNMYPEGWGELYLIVAAWGKMQIFFLRYFFKYTYWKLLYLELASWTQFRWSQFCWQHPKHHSQEPVEHRPSSLHQAWSGYWP